MVDEFRKTIMNKADMFKESTFKKGKSLARLQGDTNILTNKRDRF